ncbi:MAG: SUMF1/EgtB/PvdO family nonheme iron enzyme [Anaerolineales bacterium]
MTKKHLLYTPKILSDLPIQKAERAAFNFNDFAYTLARLIAAKETETPLVIGVSGAWGSGKTSLLKRLQDSLKQTEVLNDPSKPALIDFVNEEELPQAQFRVCKTVWFNAWKYADEDELLVALVRVITQAMFADDFVSQSAAVLLEPFTPRRDVINTVLSWFSIKVGDADVGLNTSQPQPTPFAEKTAMLDLFNDAFDKLLAAWVHHSLDHNKIDPTKGVLVVFIDDLDRCMPDKVVQVLEAVKLFLDKSGCVFVLGADTHVAQSAVTKYYSDAGVTGENASDYLEKIIQLRFDLPPVPEADMCNFVEVQSTDDPQLARHWQVISAGAELNPRKVKTFLNDINLAWALLRNMDKAHDDVKDDFVRWQVLMRAAPEAFKKKIFDIENRDLRFDYVQAALTWAKGGKNAEPVEKYFAEYTKTPRLSRTLRAIGAFTDVFNAQTLDDFMHLSAHLRQVAELGRDKEAEVSVIPEQGEGFANLEPPNLSTSYGDTAFNLAGIDFVKIPASKFLMGSKNDDPFAQGDEKPQYPLELPDYWMGRYPVTNEQYSEFVTFSRKDHPVKDWKKKRNHPVVNVSWYDAQRYIEWLNQHLQELRKAEGSALIFLPSGFVARLPSETEWEKAARGAYGNTWPWGDEFDKAKCNSDEGKKDGTTSVGAYSPQGDSPYGCADMAGNAWEWTQSKAQSYPVHYDFEGGDNFSKCVVRGGSYLNKWQFVRCANRNSEYLPSNQNQTVGFRVALSKPITKLPSHKN